MRMVTSATSVNPFQHRLIILKVNGTRAMENPRNPTLSPHRPRGTVASIHTSEHKPTDLRTSSLPRASRFDVVDDPRSLHGGSESRTGWSWMRFNRKKAQRRAPAGLFNRIKQMARPRKLQFIGASATIASPEQHGRVGRGSTTCSSRHAFEHESNGAPGVSQTTPVRPRFKVTKGGPVYNSTSLVGHQSKN